MVLPNAKIIELRAQYEQMLHNSLLVTEIAVELKERAHASEKYVCHLKSLAVRAARTISRMQNSARSFLALSHRMVSMALRQLESGHSSTLRSLKEEYERLLQILDKELHDIDETESIDFNICDPTLVNSAISERLRNLEVRQGHGLPPTGSVRSFRSMEVDEKYPENWSRDSLVDLSNVINLPPVPEDVFATFTKPTRTSSLSSLKSIKKVKLYLQRAEEEEKRKGENRRETSEDEESEFDDHDTSMSVCMSDDPTSSSEAGEARSILIKKGGGLCNIKEEAPLDPSV